MSKNFLTPIVLPAGTASNAPLTLQSGTNLTTAAAGAVEYDGKVLYSTPVARGVSPSMMFYRLNAGLAGANNTTDQKIFGVGVTLQASTVYAFQYTFTVTKTAGANTHNFGLSFGGTATINNILYMGLLSSITATSPPTGNTITSNVTINSMSNHNAVFNIATASRVLSFTLSGTVSINAGGTFIPQYTLSAAPGGAYTTVAGSYFAIWPIGASGSATTVGPWA